MAKCAYRGERIREIEEKWIDENIEDEEERRRKKEFLSIILERLGEKADCRFEAISGGEFCIFHDPNYWRGHPDEVQKEFLKHLEEDEERFFIGFHLPSIEFPKVVKKDAHMELVKLHDALKAVETKFEGEAWFGRATFEGLARFVNLIMEGSAYAVFRSSVFEKPHLVSLEGTEIMRLLFLSTEIEKISLTNANLSGEILMVHELLKNPRSHVGFTFDDVIETYGRLRGNFERNHRFSDAGKFFRGEMEARRTRRYYEFLREHEGHAATFMRRIFFNIRKGFLWVYVNFLSPYAIYKALAEYGEGVWRPLLCSLATIFSMSLFFTVLQGGQVSPQSFLKGLGKSIGLFFQLAPVDYAALPSIPPMLELLERILGLLLPGLEVIALKRMLERHP